MINYLLPRLEEILESLQTDYKLIARKNKDDEWKRDHYRYIFTITVQRTFELLNTQLTETEVPPIRESTKMELIILRDQINKMIDG